MQSSRSLAELTLEWCADEIRAGGGSHFNETIRAEELRTALREANREATKAASVALLQAAAAELNGNEQEQLGPIASVIDDEAAIIDLEQRLGAAGIGENPEHSSQQRAAAVGHTFKAWLNEHLDAGVVPEKLQQWLDRGWPDTRVRAGLTTFYQAFCGALQRKLRQESENWDSLMKKATVGFDAPTWRQFLIREAEAGGQVTRKSTRSRTFRRIAFAAILLALVGGAAWYWSKEIAARVRSLDQDPAISVKTVIPSSTPDTVGEAPSLPAPAPEPNPVVAQPTPVPKPDTKVEVRLSESPKTSNPDPIAEAARLTTVAESALKSEHPEAGDIPARSADDVISGLAPTKNAPLAESLTRLGAYWEQRKDWAEAARIHQRAVKAYEKTPAENANPQLQAVNRWATALHNSGRNTEAEKLLQMLLQAYESMGPTFNPELAVVTHNLGEVAFATKRLREARQHYAQALTLMAGTKEDIDSAPLLSIFKNDYAECLRKLGVSETQIEVETRRLLTPPTSSTPAPNR